MFCILCAALLVLAVPAASDMGSESRRVTQPQVVERPNRQLINGAERDISFVAGYSIRYTGCSSMTQVGVNNGNTYSNKNGNAEMIYTVQLAKFSLCPTGSCSADCPGRGEYVTSMETFVDAYTEAKLTAAEYACEMVRENCYCSDIDDDWACEGSCYATAGLTDCEQQENDGDAFEVQRYLECRGEFA
jgi:hypothetical protein